VRILWGDSAGVFVKVSAMAEDAQEILSVLDILNKGAAFLEKKGVEEARRNMELMTGEVLGLDRMQLYLNFERPLKEEELKQLRVMMKERAGKKPLQYVLGEVEFFKRDFSADARALIPRPETEELVELTLKQIYGNGVRVLDVGTGSGVLGLSLAMELSARCRELALSDVSAVALELARQNTERMKKEHGDDLRAAVSFYESDLLKAVAGGSYEVIAANLPYIADTEELKEELAHEPQNALFSGADGLDLIRVFIPQAFERLVPGGLLAMEIGYDQGEKVAELLKSAGFESVKVEKDLSGIARFPFARKPSI